MTSMPSHEFESLTEDEFEERYDTIMSRDGSGIWEFDQIKSRPTERVWSVVEVDGDLYAIPGWHVVNVIGYCLTRRPWEHDHIEVKFDSIPLD